MFDDYIARDDPSYGRADQRCNCTDNSVDNSVSSHNNTYNAGAAVQHRAWSRLEFNAEYVSTVMAVAVAII